jgi:predicted PurR-regulated permease PerM
MQDLSSHSTKYSSKEILYITILIAVILHFGKMVFIPLSFAMLISFLLYPVCHWIEKKGLNRSLSITIAMAFAIILIIVFIFILAIQLNSFISEWSNLKLKLYDTFNQLSEYLKDDLNVSLPQQKLWMENLVNDSGKHILPFISSTAYSVSVYAVLVIIIPVLSALILYYRDKFIKTIYLLFPSIETETIRKTLHETILTYYNFIKGMLTVYLIVGILNSTGLAILGIPYPILFGFLASILTFIPYVGIMIASLLPIAISWITFNSIWYPLGVVAIFSIVQYLEANIIFPFVVSSKLNINTFATIIAILTGGILWGGAGMILFVPFIAIIKLIADKTESLKVLSILLGTDQKPHP